MCSLIDEDKKNDASNDDHEDTTNVTLVNKLVQNTSNHFYWGFLIQKKGQMKSTSTTVDVLHHLSQPSQCLKSAQPPRTSWTSKGSHQPSDTFNNLHGLSTTSMDFQEPSLTSSSYQRLPVTSNGSHQPSETFNSLHWLSTTFIDFQQQS